MLQAAAPMRGERTLTAVAGASLRRRVSRTFDLLRARRRSAVRVVTKTPANMLL
jgi:hypothetical protein